jgi:hypothetical protein
MQDYGNPKSRNTMRAAGNIDQPAGMPGASIKGGNQAQGKGELPAKVSVPMPGTNAPSAPQGTPGSKAKAPQGFNGGIIPGKI